MTYTYDVSTDLGRLRMLIDDRDLTSVADETPLDQRSAIFSDAELQTFLDNQGGSVLLGAADALLVIAANRNLLVQSRRIGNLEVNYGAAADRLMKLASEYRLQASGSVAPADGVAEIAYNDFSARRIMDNTIARELG